MAEYVLYFHLLILVNAVLAARYSDRLAAWFKKQDADTAQRQEEGRKAMLKANAEAAERDRIRALANRKMQRLTRLRKEAAAARPDA